MENNNKLIDVIVGFVDIGGIVDQNCLNFLSVNLK